jgi:hypothetical protein
MLKVKSLLLDAFKNVELSIEGGESGEIFSPSRPKSWDGPQGKNLVALVALCG